MKKTSKQIVFFGSGPVAAESLRLLSGDFIIEAVITKPRAPHHKGTVPVLDVASSLGIPIITAEDKKELDQIFQSATFTSQVGVLIDFGIIVSQLVIDYFPLGIVNSHFSLLPEWRGADPITFSILSGQKTTGVSLMLLVQKMDEGPLLAQAPYHLSPTITTPELTDNLIKLSHHLLTAILPQYIAGNLQPKPQSALIKPSYSRKLTKNDSIIDWHKPAMQLEREIRAFQPWPKSRTMFGPLEVIVTKSHVLDLRGKSGDRAIIDTQPIVYCKEQALALDTLQPAGKNRMAGQAFLAGYRDLFLANNP